MRTLGLIGGMSWVSTAEYYRLINEMTADRLQGLHSAHIVLESVDFGEIEALKLEGEWDEIGARLVSAARRLETAGADAIVLCTNTMHYVAPQIEKSLHVPFLHIGDTTAEAVAEHGLSKVGLLATAFTMEEAFYRERFSARGVHLVTPDAAGREAVSSIIYDELCHNIVTEQSREIYLAVVDNLIDAGCEGIVLGCTEVELLIRPDDLVVPTFPSTRLHARAAVDFALPAPPNSADFENLSAPTRH
ncbi:aspartate/glutamate racemase [Rhodococcus sp. 15-725-2-2b]|jgi:aspartate racemase|uniref:aspartate/glutamate racemase family protein n=1 Tax=unclassified Rhodococcus (in: high G+C Gram-positive bacteria) TaxID=192944 RepID=UPI000B9BAC5E|nr:MULTISPECIES: aspartate/glutamate racemase family protein [unclassified Rhodococcus (in: high G+C Gram-positive bacteria)]OZC72543.1 aspartate/glutamate racemase [Rhodococcus sp. 06-469-3-2]OZD48769.1 aspartate/glutamate racemase [Rhodococcus sp. 06-1477-1A]OZE03954.1 aspartate/glutamate racemase [Rhodococcus sp. 05-2255-3B1]OZE10024.1 aspartate/glutamate racemase [Rhodococcus sp. 05-2255-3C]OZE15791.1 aspartate/glutamate racemase [Rhodococcus sp. 05-2255-2A2]